MFSSDEAKRREAIAPIADLAQVKQLLQYGQTTPSIGARFGPYRLVSELGRGGMGVVFEADQDDVEHHVAVKFMLEGELAAESDVRKFLSEAERQLHLAHPNIVPVLHVERAHGRPYFTMPLFRQNLAQARDRLPGGWQARARLLATVARAVHHAHERGLLHRDLKPANILLDDAGEPHIADFGLARRLDEMAAPQASTRGAGTPAYMAPEQAAGSKDLTVAADIYSLGAILYELLTGQVPFAGETPAAMLRRITSDDPVRPPRELRPDIPRDLEAICLQCLAKRPRDRYARAIDLADDIECVQKGRPPSISPRSLVAKVGHWLRRHPRQSKRVATMLVLALGAWWALRSLWQESLRVERAELETDAFIASGQAGAALFQLREYADRVQQAARDPAIVSLATSPKMALDPPEALKRLADGFDAAFVLTNRGYVWSQWPAPRVDISGRSYDFRDYFRGARALTDASAQNVYVARAIRSERDGELKFGVSTPLFQDGRPVGVLAAIIAADSVFGKVRMQDAGESGRVTSLLGPRDLERDEPRQWPPPERFVVLIHDGLRRGEEVAVPNQRALQMAFREAAPAGEQFFLRYGSPEFDADYVDPVKGFEGLWQAAFAPVGGTGYVIAVQTRRVAPLHPLAAVAQVFHDIARAL